MRKLSYRDDGHLAIKEWSWDSGPGCLAALCLLAFLKHYQYAHSKIGKHTHKECKTRIEKNEWHSEVKSNERENRTSICKLSPFPGSWVFNHNWGMNLPAKKKITKSELQYSHDSWLENCSFGEVKQSFSLKKNHLLLTPKFLRAKTTSYESQWGVLWKVMWKGFGGQGWLGEGCISFQGCPNNVSWIG